MRIFENELIFIEKEKSEIPWVKIFTCKKIKELSQCDKATKLMLFEALDIVERTMLEFYKPKKINIALFGNYLPHLHIHVMARFEQDSYFPESMWGKKQREASLDLPLFELFASKLQKQLSYL